MKYFYHGKHKFARDDLLFEIPENIDVLHQNLVTYLYDGYTSMENFPGWNAGLQILKDSTDNLPELFFESWSGYVVTLEHLNDPRDGEWIDTLEFLFGKELAEYF